jgi:hypothetical protein
VKSTAALILLAGLLAGCGGGGDDAPVNNPPPTSTRDFAGFAEGVDVGDLDNDGDLDIVIGIILNGTEMGNRVLFNDGNGDFVATDQQLGSRRTSAIAIGDLNGDNHLDFVAGNHGFDVGGQRDTPTEDIVWFNDGGGNFTAGPALGNEVTRDVVLADVDGDNELDILTANGEINSVQGKGISVYIHTGAGQFDTEVKYLTAFAMTALTVADFDGQDGVDIAAVGVNDMHILFNNGDGTFGNAVRIALNETTKDIVAADVDNANGPDLVVSYGTAIRVWTNNGSGVFANSGQTLGDVVVSSIAIGDANNTILPDLFTVREAGAAGNSIWINVAGTFSASTLAPGPTGQMFCVAAGDFDSDGIDDRVESGRNGTFVVLTE